MSSTLYRTYRPQIFAEVVGQALVTQTLQNEIINKRLAHAYLFSGPRGLGKTTTARLLAKAVNCSTRKDSSAEPCNSCPSCQAIVDNQSLDVIEIDAASHRGINEIRQLKEHIGFTPSGAQFRVFIIDEVHMLTTEAFNALLKTLEEPPAHAIFILATTELHKVPDTILSRCQTFAFKKLGNQETIDRLKFIAKQEGVVIADEVLQVIARQSGGFLRDAESQLGQVIAVGEKKIDADIASLVLPGSSYEEIVSMMRAFAKSDTSEALVLFHTMIDRGTDSVYLAQEMLELGRQVLLQQYNAAKQPDETIQALAAQFDAAALVRLVTLLSGALQRMKYTDMPELVFELFIIEYCSEDDGNTEDIENAENNKTETKVIETSEVVAKAKAPKKEKSADKKTPAKAVKIVIDDITSRWHEVVTASRKHNHSVSLALKISHPLEVSDESVELGCAYDFHLDRLNDTKNKNIIEKVLSDVFGCLLKIKTRRLTQEEEQQFNPALDKKAQAQEDKMVEEVLHAFGGQLVSD